MQTTDQIVSALGNKQRAWEEALTYAFRCRQEAEGWGCLRLAEHTIVMLRLKVPQATPVTW